MASPAKTCDYAKMGVKSKGNKLKASIADCQ